MVASESSLDVLGTNISNVNPLLACQSIEKWIERREKAYICVANVATIVDCQKDQDYRNVINGADLVTPDGMPLVWIGKRRGSQDIQRTYGPDLMHYLCDRGQSKRIKHYFYGGTDKNLELLKINLEQQYPEIRIAGCFAPAFKKVKEIESDDIIEDINQAAPDILWVGLGSPKQDYWMAQHRERLNVPVLIGVGAAFDFIAGVKKQAPKWMQKCGLEWFFRLCAEPRRLWKRYLVGNAQFLYYLTKEKLRK